jgi:hypothetical protein
MDNSRSFVAEPNLNVKVEVVTNLVEPGNDEGVKFYDRFKLKKDDDGDPRYLEEGLARFGDRRRSPTSGRGPRGPRLGEARDGQTCRRRTAIRTAPHPPVLEG